MECVVCGHSLRDVEGVGGHVAGVVVGEETTVNDRLGCGLGDADVGHQAGQLGGAGLVVADESCAFVLGGAELRQRTSVICSRRYIMFSSALTITGACAVFGFWLRSSSSGVLTMVPS